MSVDDYVPADQIPGELVRSAGTVSTGFQINTGFDRKVLEKIEGAPTPQNLLDARREAYLAYELAKRRDVEDVLLGEQAVSFMYRNSKGLGDQDVDVIARLKGGDVIIGDAKGQHFGKALVEQLPHSTWVLRERGLNVVEGLVLALQPKTIIVFGAEDKEPGEWRQVGKKHASIDPKTVTEVDPAHPADPHSIYLLDPDFHTVHNPTGLLIDPHTNFPLLRTHIYAPLLGERHHMQSGIWQEIHPFTIPTTGAHVKIGFVY